MGKTLIFLMLFLSNVALAQLYDDFSDGDFTINPVWTGSTSLFTINANKQLQSVLNSNSQTITLATLNGYALNAKWEFFVQMNFDPSATNLTRIYLVSDQQDLNLALNGYFIQVGESGNTDAYHLYKQTGTSITRIITGAQKTRANVNVLTARIKVTRDDYGRWELYTDIAGGNNFNLEGSTTDATHTISNWFGVYCKYTATRSNGFIFDDFSITELVPDVTPPTLLSVKTISDNQIEATFSEPLSNASALVTSNYSLSNIGSPLSISNTIDHVYLLTYSSVIPSGFYTLTVNDVKDLKGNNIASNNAITFFHLKAYAAKKGDIVINEIFADPSPVIGLPTTEFVELWNTTSEYIPLKGWKYSDLTTTYTFGDEVMLPNSYLILCQASAVAAYQNFGKTIGISPWPTLNNDKDDLKIESNAGVLIDEVAYTDDWYKDAIKKQGGYTLELIDANNKCKGIQNWGGSNAIIGGTPGAQNSVYQSQLSTAAPQLLAATIIDATTIRLTFSKYIDGSAASNPAHYNVNNGVGTALSALPIAPAFTTVEIKLANQLVRGVDNLLTITGLTDCAGNEIDPAANTAKLFWAKEIKQGNLLISEVLFNPRGSNPDYVEIYNNTNDVFDLKELQLGNAAADGKEANIKTITHHSIYIHPKTYWVLTNNPTLVKQQYEAKFPNQFIALASLPAYNNDKGSVILLNGTAIIDRFDYTEKMHMPLLADPKGVALERISFARATNEPGNFTSAAQTVGFGTPTGPNSQMADESILKNGITLSSQTFSPDGDGFEDVLNINYQFRESGNLATINIYTDKGILVKKLQRNTSISTSGSFIWDGKNDHGQLSKIGIYIIKFEVNSLNGKSDKFIKTCVLATKL